MAEYIEKNKLLKDMHSVYTSPIFHKTIEDYMFEKMVGIVEKQPSADVVEVKRGYWKEIQGEIGNPFNNQVMDTIDLLVCSVCNEIFDISEARNYCPNCGAKMDKERKENK